MGTGIVGTLFDFILVDVSRMLPSTFNLLNTNTSSQTPRKKRFNEPKS